LEDRSRFQILAPVVRGKKGTHKKLLSSLAAEGFVRVRVDGEILELSDTIELNKNKKHDIEVVVDRLVKKEGIEERLADSLSTCLQHAEGIAIISLMSSDKQNEEAELVFSENFACPEHGAVMNELSPRLFSFNSPYGACPECHGLGSLRKFSPQLIIPDSTQPVYSAIAPWSEKDSSYYISLLHALGQAYGFELSTPWSELTTQQQEILLYGCDQEIYVDGETYKGDRHGYYKRYVGVIPTLERQYESSPDKYKEKLEPYIINQTCAVCEGKRLKPETLAVRLGQYCITELTEVSISQCLEKVAKLALTPRQAQIGELALKEIKARLQFLLDVGLDYLTLDRPAMTLSGGEAQRIRLATQIGAGLTGVLYVLDEPSIGLHQRDNSRLLSTLEKLRDLGNTLIVVEHDEETIRSADQIVGTG
ncbi:MAG: excinuclease ABC subunit A, partial [Okeania sp. SIO2D1]|nr:excinuclease ABC subunit A [Okeania sp. SIO2D1]